MQSVKAGAGPTDRAIVPQPLRVDFVRPLARTLAIAAAALAVVDFVAGSVLYVTDGAIPRVIWAAAYALPSYDDGYYAPDVFGSGTGAAVPLDDYDFGQFR